jgi:hypothetical protein
MKKLFVLCIGLLMTLGLSAQSFFDTGTIQEIRIYFSIPNWDYQMDTAKWGADGYVSADSVKINGVLLGQSGVKYKGNSSYDSTAIKNPLNISLDEYVNQDYNGVSTIKLSNQYLDPSMIREVLAYSMLGNYMIVPKANFASVYINENWLGMYTNTQTIDKAFCAEQFQYSKGTFFKCNPILNPSPSTKSNLKYIDSDSSSYFNFYELKSSAGWNELVGLCDSIVNHPEALPSLMDMDRFILMLAFDNAMINLDSYMGVFAQNYYLYKDGTQRFNPIVWDLNMCFGGFPYIGGGGSSMGSLTITDQQQLSGNAHSTDAYWPMIKWIQSHPTYKKMYWAHLKTIVEEMIQSGVYLNLAAAYQALIDPMVAQDPNLFFDYTAFQNGLNISASSGTYMIPGIQSLMDARATYLSSTTEWNYSAPDIQPITPSNVEVGSNLNMQVVVGNASEVYLGYRFYNGKAFVRIPMLDDGQHNDGAAGDGIFGVSLVMSSGFMEYYFYAQNQNAGGFSPVRAEHEFYTLNASFSNSAPPVLNESVVSNANGSVNHFGDHSDWIEIKNNTNSSIGLNGYFLSDNANDLQKFAFGSSDFIAPNGRLMVWCDDRYESEVIHAHFALNSLGDTLYLSNSLGEIIDSVSFQNIPTDSSWARCPDGLGDWNLTWPTFNAANCEVVNIEEWVDGKYGLPYPNPCSSRLFIQSDISEPYQIYNGNGSVVLSGFIQIGTHSIDTNRLSDGLYFLSKGTRSFHFLVQH